MIKSCLLAISCLIINCCKSQHNFLLLKKNEKTIQRYFVGSPVQFYTSGLGVYQGYIAALRNDSIFIKTGGTALVGKGFGSVIDTVYTGSLELSIKNIEIVVAKRLSAAKTGNLMFRGTLMMGGIIAINNIEIDNFNQRSLVRFLSLPIVNYLAGLIEPFKQHKPSGYRIGKKYKLQFISTQ